MQRHNSSPRQMTGVVYTEAFKKRFWAKVDSSGGANSCWEWQGALTGAGYGYISVRVCGIRARYKAHRVALVLATGVDNPEMMVLHSCDFPLCCNPEHLRYGTQLNNVTDCVERGRVPHGEAHSSSKLTESQVVKMRELRAGGVTLQDLAELFGLDVTTAHKIVTGKQWLAAPGPITPAKKRRKGIDAKVVK